MPYYAQLNNDKKVVAVTEAAKQLSDASLIEIDGLKSSLLGNIYDPVTKKFNVPAVPASKVLTKLQFMNRFTNEELVGIYTAAKASVAVEIWLEKFKLSTEVDLSNSDTIAGIQALEAAGLIQSGRAAVILG